MAVVWILVVLVGIVAAQCPGRYSNGEVAGIAVGVAFATLALCLIILGLVMLFNKKKKQDAQQGKNAGTTDKRGQSFDNPSFQADDAGGATAQSDAEQRLSFAEKGFGGYVPTADYRPSKTKVISVISTSSSQGHQGSSPNNNNNNDSLKRSLMKLKPSPQYSIGNARTGSQGSLDASCQNIDPEVISVSLQSEDIIGLGFNITGSMRDGIFVSQVHNRGPASESGCIKPGDRIMGITISFENMVYEDALTILSYASPYPVRLQLQKNMPSSSRVDASVTSGNDEDVLHHPVYRSQSMDDVSKIARDSVFNVRRARSEMKRGSSKKNDQTVPEGTLRKWNGNMEASITGPSLAVNVPDLDINTSSLRMDEQLTTASIHGQGGLKAREIDLPDGDPEANVLGNFRKVKGNVKFDKPNVDLHGGDFSMKELNFDDSSGEFDINGQGDYNLSGSNNVDLQLPSANFKGVKGTSPDVNFSRPSGDGQVQIQYDPPDADIDVHKKSGFKMPGFKLPGFKKSKSPSGDVDIKANVDIPDVKVTGGDTDIHMGKNIDLPDVEFGSKSEVDLDDPNLSGSFNVEGGGVKGKGPGFKMPDINLPSFKKSKSPDADVELKVKGGVGADRPDISRNVDVDMDGGDVKGKGHGFKLPDISLPSFKKQKGPDFDADVKVKGEVDRPDISGDLDVDMDGGDVKAKGPSFKMPDFNLPSFKKPKGPDADIDFDVKGDVDVEGPNISGDMDVKGGNIKAKGPGFKLPDVSLPSFKKSRGPDADIDFDVKGDVDVEGPNISGDMDVKGGNIKAKGPGFKLPDVSLPSFKKSRGPDADIDFDVKGDVDVEGPNISGDMDVKGGNIKAKGPGFKLPDVSLPSFKKPRGPDADIDFDVKGDVDVEGPNISGDMDVKGGNIKAKGPGFKLPDVSLPSFKKPRGPDADIDFGVKGDVDVEGPNISGDMDVKGGNINAKGPGFKLPDVSLPSFKKPRGPDADIDFDVKGDVDVEGPNISGDMDVKGGNIKAKGSGFKLPDVNLPSFKKPKGPKADVDFDVSGEFDLEKPDISGDIDIDGGEIKAKGPGFKMPEFHLPSFKKSKGPDVDVDLDVNNGVSIDKPNISGDIDIEGGDFEAKGLGFKMPNFKLPSFKSPKAEFDADVDAEFDTPKLNLGQGLSGDVDFDVDGKDIDVSAGKVNLKDVDLPDVDLKLKGPAVSGDVDIEGPEIHGKKGSGFKLPDFNLPGFKKKEKLPDMDVDANADIDFDGSMRGGKFDLSAPDVDVEAPNVDMDLNMDGRILKKESGFKLPGFKRPSMKKGETYFDPNVKLDAQADVELPHFDDNKPEISGDIDLKGGEVKASKDHGFSLPDFKLPGFKKPGVKANIEGDADLPDVDTDANIDVDIKGAGVKTKGSGFKFPGFKKPKVNAPDVDIDGNVKLDTGKVKSDVDLPDVDVNAGRIGVGMPKVSGNVDAGDLYIKAPKVDGDLPHVDLDTKGSISLDTNLSGDFDVEGHGKGSKGFGFKLPDFKMPGFKKHDVDLDVPNVDIKGGIKADADLPDLEGPDFNAKWKGPEISGPNYELGNVNVNAPRVNADVDAPNFDTPNANADVKGSGFNLPEFKLPSLHKPDINPPDVVAPTVDAHGDAHIKGSLPNADLDLPDVNVKVQKPNIDVKAPDVKVEKKHTGFKLPHFKMPGRKKGSVKAPEVSGPELTIPEAEAPNLEVNAPKLPQAGLGMPGVAMPGYSRSGWSQGANMNLPNADVDLKGPSIKGASGELSTDIEMPSISAPSVSVSKDIPNFESSLKAPSLGNADSDISATFDASEVSVTAPKYSLPDSAVSGSITRSDVTIPDVNHDIKLPYADISAEAPEVDVALPNLGFSADADIDADLKLKKEDKDKKKKKKGDEDKPKKKEEDKGEKKKSGIQGWWQRRRRRRSNSSSHSSSSSSDSEDENEKATVTLPSASFSVPSVSMPAASIATSSDESLSAFVSVPHVETSIPDVSASALPSISRETSSKSVDISMTEPKVVLPTMSGSDEDVSVSLPDSSSITAPSLDVEGNLAVPSFSMNAEDSSGDEEKDHSMMIELPPIVAHEIEVHTEPSVPSDDDFEEISNWRTDVSVPAAWATFPEEPDVTNASMRVNLDQDSILVRDNEAPEDTTSEEEDDQERVSAMLREYLADDPLLMERLGFGAETARHEASAGVSADVSDYLSRNGEALSGARQEIRRRSRSSSPGRRRKWSDSCSSSGSSSPKPSQPQDVDFRLPSLESSTNWESESPSVRMSSGGIAYNLTPEQLEQLSPEERERIREEPRGGMAYYFDINDQLMIGNDQDDEEADTHPPLVNPRTLETESIHTQLNTNHLTDSDQEDQDSENMSTSISKTMNLNSNFRGNRSNDGNVAVKTVETTSTTVSRGESESNKTYTVTITTTQMDDSEA